MFDFFFFQAEDGIRDRLVTGVQTCALPILVRKQWRNFPVEATLNLCGSFHFFDFCVFFSCADSGQNPVDDFEQRHAVSRCDPSPAHL